MPLYFVRSGNVNLNIGALRNFGLNGRGWSRSAGGWSNNDTWSANAYWFEFTASGVNPSGNNARWDGLPVRCLVY